MKRIFPALLFVWLLLGMTPLSATVTLETFTFDSIFRGPH